MRRLVLAFLRGIGLAVSGVAGKQQKEGTKQEAKQEMTQEAKQEAVEQVTQEEQGTEAADTATVQEEQPADTAAAQTEG